MRRFRRQIGCCTSSRLLRCCMAGRCRCSRLDLRTGARAVGGRGSSRLRSPCGGVRRRCRARRCRGAPAPGRWVRRSGRRVSAQRRRLSRVRFLGRRSARGRLPPPPAEFTDVTRQRDESARCASPPTSSWSPGSAKTSGTCSSYTRPKLRVLRSLLTAVRISPRSCGLSTSATRSSMCATTLRIVRAGPLRPRPQEPTDEWPQRRGVRSRAHRTRRGSSPPRCRIRREAAWRVHGRTGARVRYADSPLSGLHLPACRTGATARRLRRDTRRRGCCHPGALPGPYAPAGRSRLVVAAEVL